MAKDSLKLFYALVPNSLPETEGYHAAVSHVGTVDAATFFARVAARRPGLEPSTAELVLASVCSTAAEILAERQYRIALGDVTFELAIPGSTDSIDGAMSSPAYVAVRPSAAIRNAAAGITPVYSAGDGERTEVFSVEDVATRGRNAIVGTTAFRLAGANLSATGDGESLKVFAADGTEAVAEVTDEDGLGMFITAHLTVALPPGKGKVVLMTHGKRTPEGELHQCVKSVTILDGDEPVPEPATVTLRTAITEGMMDNNIRSGSEPVTLVGENLTLGEGDTLWAKNYDNGDEDYVEIPLTFVKRNTSAAIDLGDDVNDPFWAWLGEQVEFTEEHDRITFKLVSHGGVPSSEPQVRTCTSVVQFA